MRNEVTLNQAETVTVTFTADPVPPVCPPKKLKERGLSKNVKKGFAKPKVTAGGSGKVILKGLKNSRKLSEKMGSPGSGRPTKIASARVKLAKR